MMAASTDYLKSQDFTAERNGERIRISPASRLTPAVRNFVYFNRDSLLAELTFGDGLERRRNWKISYAGMRIPLLSREPCTAAEALASAPSHWVGATIIENHWSPDGSPIEGGAPHE